MQSQNKYHSGGFAFGTILAFIFLYSPYIISIMALLYSILSSTLSGIAYLIFVIVCCSIGSLINFLYKDM